MGIGYDTTVKEVIKAFARPTDYSYSVICNGEVELCCSTADNHNYYMILTKNDAIRVLFSFTMNVYGETTINKVSITYNCMITRLDPEGVIDAQIGSLLNT
jgi:hypothetical protein